MSVIKHGMCETSIYRIWRNIKSRCLNPSRKDFKYYGARGITLATEWEHDFTAFYNYVSTLEHFGDEKFWLDRIDNDGNYEVGNLRWVDIKTQARNTRQTVYVDYFGTKMVSSDAAELSGISTATLRKRIKKGLTGAELFKPTKKHIPKSDLILVENNQALTTSLKVAEVFEKEHFHVMRDIEEIIRQLAVETASGFDNPNLDFQKMFIKSEYAVKRQTRKYPMYYMNRDGFLLLVMAFTGQKAFHFKLEFIAEFNRMEAALKK